MTALIDPPASAAPTTRPVRRRRVRPERASFLLLLAATAVAYLWSLSESGYANQFYAAAAQAGSQSWKAFLFGSLDAGNAITVDKPPAALWVMGLSVRLFGLSSWSILVPEALMGVATVALIYALVRRVAAWPAALAAGAFTALTPATALMFRFDNPDALLLLVLVGSGYATLRAAETGRGRWLVLAGALVGVGFLTKMLQAFLVLPAFASAYVVAAPVPLRKRIAQLLGGVAAMVLSAGWWVAIVELVPASDRPYVDGSTRNSILELVFGYNGFGRLTGNETGGLGNAGFSSGTGLLRLFEGVSGGMVGWLLPAALILLVAAVVLLRRAPRTDRTRAALILCGGALVVTGLVFSFMAGIYHDYYTVALAPWIAGTAVIGAVVCWRRRELFAVRAVLAVAAILSTVWAVVLLGQSDQQPYDALRWPVLLGGLVATGGLLLLDQLARRWAVTVAVATAVVLGIGPAAYTVETIGTPHTGSIVTAGPYTSGGLGGGLGGGPGGGPGGGTPRGGFGGAAPQGRAQGSLPQSRGGNTTGSAGARGGVLGGSQVSADLASALKQNAGEYRWVAATNGSQSAASYELATGESVMAIGGFNGTAPSVSLRQFETYVDDGLIHYYLPSGGAGGMGGLSRGSDSESTKIATWVERNFTATTIGGTTVYDLTGSSTAGGTSSAVNS